ncbi:MAG: hypothetical protein COX65_09155 [Elusimicrobia bacterium CG_4_10_14_0_2_um_filter_56_8]|nr:MAG: hypothetical protein AUJ51_09300 [Elusimicrobia bacterium CG1_02_56_21]PJA12037.1 MAG: hypothetical protein COX65_09155 [Elusimicrobia bacterium CG_4_10_14_0_2_um_filter_56_8]
MFIKLKVHPDSRREKVIKKGPDAYEIWTKSPPARGLANASAIRQLSLVLNIDAKKIMLIKGATSTAKIVKIFSPVIKK